MAAPVRMERETVVNTVRGLRATEGEVLGQRVHVFYETMPTARPATPRAVAEAARAEALGIERQRFTGIVNKVWTAKDGSLCLNIQVELERASADGKPCYRTLNITKGDVVAIVALG